MALSHFIYLLVGFVVKLLYKKVGMVHFLCQLTYTVIWVSSLQTLSIGTMNFLIFCEVPRIGGQDEEGNIILC